MPESINYIFIEPASESDSQAIRDFLIADQDFPSFTCEADFEPYMQSDGSMQFSSKVLPLDYIKYNQQTLDFLAFVSKHAAFEFQKETF